MRGFGLNELSPPGPPDENGNPTEEGGENKLVASIEIERDLPRDFRIAAFYDTGNAFNDWGDPLDYSVGIGVRYKLPMLMIGLDVAQALSEPDKNPRLHLNITQVLRVTRRVLAIGGLVLLLVHGGAHGVGRAGSSTPRRDSISSLRRLETLSAVSITASGARGTIGGPLEFDTLVIDHEAVRIDARELRLQPELSNLLSRTISIASAEAGTLEVTLRRRGPQPPSEPHFMPHPLRLLVGRFDLRRVALVLTNGQRYSVASINGALTMDHWVLHAPIVTIKDPAGELAGEVRLRAGRPMGVTGTLSGRWRLPDGHDYRFSSAVRGNLDRLGTDVRLVQPARLSFSGNALALTAAPRVVGTLRAIEFDGSPWVPAGRFPRVSGSIAINAGRNSIGVDGTLTSTGLVDEPLRLQGGGTWQGRVIEITTLRAWLPRSGASFTTAGKIDLAPERRCSRSAASGRHCAGRSRATRSSRARSAATGSAAACRTPTK